MTLTAELDEILRTEQETRHKLIGLTRLQNLIKEKKEKGILRKKTVCLPTLQETEQHGYNSLFANQAS